MTRKEAGKVRPGQRVTDRKRPDLGVMTVRDKSWCGDPIWFAIQAGNGEVLCRSHWDLKLVPGTP